MKYRFLIRLDDFCPGCNLLNWNRFIDELRCMQVLCIVGVIPENMDKSFTTEEVDIRGYKKLLEKMKECENIVFAQHGLNHLISKNLSKPYLALFTRSEFSDYEDIVFKLTRGKKILNMSGVDAQLYMAPAHGLSVNHLGHVKDAGFEMITDGLSFRPYIYRGIRFIPQQLWSFRRMPFGTWTICYHPNNMTETQISLELNAIMDARKFGVKNLCDLEFETYGLLDRFFYIIYSFLFKYVKH